MKLNVQSSPHVRDSVNTRGIMLDVIIALLPASIWGILRFGLNSALVIIVSVVTCILSETVYNKIVKKPNTINDLSCVVTGMILALNMPPEVFLYVPIVGSIFAIIIVKMLFGGLGQNFMNPALAGRAFCFTSFAGQMNNFAAPHLQNIDAYSGATALALLKEGKEVSLFDSFMGFEPGCIGEVSVCCLLIGVIYLLYRRVITWRIPVIYVVSFMIFITLFSGRAITPNYLLGELFSGGLIFGAFFMANDYATSPVTPMGQVIYAIFLGVLTGVFRLFGKTGECISFIILLGNILTPLIESFTIPRAFGKEGK